MPLVTMFEVCKMASLKSLSDTWKIMTSFLFVFRRLGDSEISEMNLMVIYLSIMEVKRLMVVVADGIVVGLVFFKSHGETSVRGCW